MRSIHSWQTISNHLGWLIKTPGLKAAAFKAAQQTKARRTKAQATLSSATSALGDLLNCSAPLFTMCILELPSSPIPVLPSLSRSGRRWLEPRRCNPSNLIYPTVSTHVEQVVAGGLWNCQSAVLIAKDILGYATALSLNFLALTETWIKPENTATPAALSAGFSFTHSPRVGRHGGGTGLLIADKWKYSNISLSHFSPSSFEFHAVTVTHPVKLTIVVLYRPPGPVSL